MNLTVTWMVLVSQSVNPILPTSLPTSTSTYTSTSTSTSTSCYLLLPTISSSHGLQEVIKRNILMLYFIKEPPSTIGHPFLNPSNHETSSSNDLKSTLHISRNQPNPKPLLDLAPHPSCFTSSFYWFYWISCNFIPSWIHDRCQARLFVSLRAWEEFLLEAYGVLTVRPPRPIIRMNSRSHTCGQRISSSCICYWLSFHLPLILDNGSIKNSFTPSPHNTEAFVGVKRQSIFGEASFKILHIHSLFFSLLYLIVHGQ